MLSNWRIDSKSPMPTNLLASHVLVRLGVNGVTGASHISEKCLKRKSLYTPIYYIIIIYIYYIYIHISVMCIQLMCLVNLPSWYKLRHVAWQSFSILAVIQHGGGGGGGIKENIKAPRHWPLWGEFTGDHKGPVTRIFFSIWCRHHVGDIILVPAHVFKSLQLISRTGTRRLQLRTPNIETNCSDSTKRVPR